MSTSESSGGLVTIGGAEPTPRVSNSVVLVGERGWIISFSNKFPGAAAAAGLVTTLATSRVAKTFGYRITPRSSSAPYTKSEHGQVT